MPPLSAIADWSFATVIHNQVPDLTHPWMLVESSHRMCCIEDFATDPAADGNDHEPRYVYAEAQVPCSCAHIVDDVGLASRQSLDIRYKIGNLNLSTEKRGSL